MPVITVTWGRTKIWARSWAAQILVTFNDRPFVVFLRSTMRSTLQLRAHHQIGGAAFFAHGVKDHGRDGGFPALPATTIRFLLAVAKRKNSG